LNVLYSTLLCKDYGRRSENLHLAAIAAQAGEFATRGFRLQILIASAHQAALDRAAATLSAVGRPADFIRLPFVGRPEFNEQRAHEIGWCKQRLVRLWLERDDHDVILFLDSDLSVGIGQLAAMLERSAGEANVFYSIPYVIHQRLEAPPQQFGAYFHASALLRKADYSDAVYQVATRGGKLFRLDAPDCAVRSFLLRAGAKEIRLAPPNYHIQTRHYSENGTYGLYDGGTMSRHSISGMPAAK
jgi:hypothetical protein